MNPLLLYKHQANSLSSGIQLMFFVRSRIVITSRSPLKNFWQDYRVEFVAIDFLKPIEEIIQKLAPFCTDVTHAFFTSYAHSDDFDRLRDLNVPLFENFLTAIDKVASGSLERICLQTGGKVSQLLCLIIRPFLS